MRDKDYDLTKPPHTFRIALLGSSMEMGWGVENKVAPWDTHPNATGHRLVADRLCKAIRENETLKELLALGSSVSR